jgi:hypothetical protein
MLPFPVTAETSMTWCLVWMLAARLNPCPEENSNSGKRLTVEKTEVVDPFSTGSRRRTVWGTPQPNPVVVPTSGGDR